MNTDKARAVQLGQDLGFGTKALPQKINITMRG